MGHRPGVEVGHRLEAGFRWAYRLFRGPWQALAVAVVCVLLLAGWVIGLTIPL